jgi:hypothetical protein
MSLVFGSMITRSSLVEPRSGLAPPACPSCLAQRRAHGDPVQPGVEQGGIAQRSRPADRP